MVKQTTQRGSRLRLVAAGTVAALLLGSSFYAAQAGSNGGYGDSLNGAEITAIVIGGAGAAYAVANMMSNRGGEEETSDGKAKSAKAGKVEQVRVLPSQHQMTSGDTTAVEVQARYQGSKSWQTVTDSASVRLVTGELTTVDGSKNAFAVPYGSKVVPGSATIEATFGGQSASTTIAVN